MTNTRLRGIAWCGLLSVLSWFLPTQEAQADVIHYKFEGNVTTILGLGSAPPFDLQSTLTVLLTYNTDINDIDPTLGLGLYEGDIDSLSITVGTYSASAGTVVGGTPINQMAIINDFGGQDAFQLVSSLVGGDVNGFLPSSLVILVTDSSRTAFDSEALGRLPPSISAFNGKNFYQLAFGGSGSPSIFGSITSVSPSTVPLPPAIILFGAGLVALVGLGARNWRQRRPSLT